MAIPLRCTCAPALIRRVCVARVLRGPVVLTLGIVLLAGCAPTTGSAELSSVERAAIRVDLQTEHWKIVSSQFPDATRPQLAVVHTAHDGDWQASIVHCLRSEGFTVFVDGLYRYYVGTVRPCLLVSGVPSEAPPTRSTFLLSVPARNSWNPYRLAWNSVMPASRLAFIQQLCPPLPGWMDLAQ